MGTITTTTQANPFDYPNQAYMTIDPRNGSDLWVMVQNTAGGYELWKSFDGGTSWTLHGTALTRANVQEYGRIQITIDGWMHWIYRTNESSQDRIYYRRIATWQTSWQAEKLVASPANGGVAGAYHTGIDYALDRQGATETTYVAIAAGTQSGANQGVTMYALTAKPDNIVTVNNGLVSGTRQWLSAGTGRMSVSADKEHNGDGLTRASNNPHVWVAWGRTSVRMVKLAWSSGKWVGPTSPVVVVATVTAQDQMPARWDGSRFLIAVPDQDDTTRVRVYQRDQANTVTSSVQTPQHPTGVIRSWGVNYNSTTGDTRVYAVGTSTAVLYYVDYVRATGVWTSWAQVVATAVLNVSNWGTRPATNGPARYDVYVAHSTPTPNTLVSYRQAVAYPPNTPTWEATSTPYASGGAASVSAALFLDWLFSDADPADVQTSWALSRQIGAGALAYWRASDSTWQAAEVKNAGATSSVTLPSGWGLATDATHTYKAKVWDSADTASSYSAPLAVTPASPVAPTITAPANASTVTADSAALTWTVSEQSAYRVVVEKAGVQVYDSGYVTSTATSVTPPVTLQDLTSYTYRLQTKNLKGLASSQVSTTFNVDYVEPATPTLVVTAMTSLGVIRVAITNPTPTGGQPALSTQELWRRVVGDTSDGVMVESGLASGATYDDWTPAASTAYQYRVSAKGTNGTSVWSAWTT